MSSPQAENAEISSSADVVNGGCNNEAVASSSDSIRPPAKRPVSTAVIEISDTDTDDSDICAVTSYQASADEVKRIRRVSDYSSSSSSSDYSSDSESPWEDDSVVLDDKKDKRCSRKRPLNKRANRMDEPIFNTNVKSEETTTELTAHWATEKDFSSDNVTLSCAPFRVCRIKNFLSNPEIINNIVDDMNTLDWSRKKMDLYEFHQTADLASLTWQRSIRGIYEMLKTDVMKWVSKVTGLELTSISASCSLYGPGDHLLVHDDLLSDRRVAFIFYLAPWKPDLNELQNGCLVVDDDCTSSGWSESMGGALQLLDVGDDGRPKDVVKSLYPSNNTMAFFKVGHNTFHQVDEVLSVQLPRLSINGWFHGPEPSEDLPKPPSPMPEPEKIKPGTQVVVITDWLASTYMSPRTRAQIQNQMESSSEVSLKQLLQDTVVDRLLREMEDDSSWTKLGPADLCHCERWASSAESSASSLLGVFTSLPFIRLIKDCTDLNIVQCSEPQLLRFQPGDYTLLPPESWSSTPRLEMLLSFWATETNEGAGGQNTFVSASEADGTLLTVPTEHNAMALVYCEPNVAYFTKYLNKLRSAQRKIYLFKCSYFE